MEYIFLYYIAFSKMLLFFFWLVTFPLVKTLSLLPSASLCFPISWKYKNEDNLWTEISTLPRLSCMKQRKGSSMKYVRIKLSFFRQLSLSLPVHAYVFAFSFVIFVYTWSLGEISIVNHHVTPSRDTIAWHHRVTPSRDTIAWHHRVTPSRDTIAWHHHYTARFLFWNLENIETYLRAL